VSFSFVIALLVSYAKFQAVYFLYSRQEVGGVSRESSLGTGHVKNDFGGSLCLCAAKLEPKKKFQYYFVLRYGVVINTPLIP